MKEIELILQDTPTELANLQLMVSKVSCSLKRDCRIIKKIQIQSIRNLRKNHSAAQLISIPHTS